MKKVIITLLMIAMVTAPFSVEANSTKYATQTINLRNKAGGKVLKKVKRNTPLQQIRAGNKWSIVKYKGKRYVTIKRYLNDEKLLSKAKSQYYIDYLRTTAPVNWRGRKYTYYTSKILPINKLPVEGLHLDKNGMWCDRWDYIVLGSSRANKASRAIIATPFGKYGKVYDTGTINTPSWLCDTATNW